MIESIVGEGVGEEKTNDWKGGVGKQMTPIIC